MRASDLLGIFPDARLVGDKDFVIMGVGAAATAAPDSVCFIEAEKYLEGFKKSASRAWIITPNIFDSLEQKIKDERIFFVTEKPYNSFVKLVNHLFPPKKIRAGIHPAAFVDSSAIVDPTAQIHAHVTIEAGAKISQHVVLYPGVWIGENAIIGENSILYGGVKIYHDSVIGKRNILHAGCVIGSDGFGFIPDKTGLLKIPQVGKAILNDDVEVGANSTIDRGTIEDTVIGRGTKIDNLVQIGHNCKVGENCIMCAFVGVSGNTTIGNNVLLAGQVGTKGHMKIGDNTQVGAQSGVSKDVPPNSKVKGYPPQPLKEYLRLQALIQKLPDIYKRLVKLEEEKS